MAGKENESNRLFENEKVIEIEIERLRSFKDHPFKVTDDKEMHLLKDSIKQYQLWRRRDKPWHMSVFQKI